MNPLLNRREVLATGLTAPLVSPTCGDDPPRPNQLDRATGYRGIWYSNQPTRDQYRYKYSGGFATYPQQHIPIAYYSQEAQKTFFCYGGTVVNRRQLLHMVSYYDHRTGTVPRPVVLLNKQTSDAHDNPVLMLDDDGHIWIFSNSHGTGRPSYIHRSTRPHRIDAFERVARTNFSYGQPWWIPRRGFLFLHTKYGQGGRNLVWKTSRNGREWSEMHRFARMDKGHYQISWRHRTTVGTAFNYHPNPIGLNARTNLYFLQTSDVGQTWQTVDGQQVRTPVTDVRTPALVHDYKSANRLVYLKDLQFDSHGHPIILYMTSSGYRPGSQNNPRTWHTARWTGTRWDIRDVTQSDHNYDFGSFYIEEGGVWKIIAPTGRGPQAFGTGGEVQMWISPNQGEDWRMTRQLTQRSPRNHTYVRRPVNAHEDFYALWADGDALRPSESYLYFTNKAGTRVSRLPATMNEASMRPEVLEW